MDTQTASAIATTDNWHALRTLARSSLASGRSTPEFDTALRDRAIMLARQMVIAELPLSGPRDPVDERIVDAIALYAAISKLAGQHPAYTIKQLRRLGPRGTVEASVSQDKPAKGFTTLSEVDRGVASFEQIIVEHPDRFSPRALWHAQRNLNLKPFARIRPVQLDSPAQSHTVALLTWLGERAALGLGAINPYSQSEAAAAAGTTGRALGNATSRIDFACFACGLPPLGLTADRPFAKAWATQKRDWSYPVESMKAAARSRIWTDSDFERLRLMTTNISGVAAAAWNDASEHEEDRLRAWAFSLGELTTSEVNPTKVALPHSSTALVLAENEEFADKSYSWRDVTGERYEFPNQYRNQIVPGARFVYYRGSRRSDGRRAVPDYFGAGTIGDVYPDPATVALAPRNRRWIAEITDYSRFEQPVPFRFADGVYAETGTADVEANRWGVGVRRIALACFVDILRRGGLALGFEEAASVQQSDGALTTLEPTESSLLLPREPRAPASAANLFCYRRQSKRAKETGDEAERLFWNWLRSGEPVESRRNEIHWVAQAGETPGYDIADCRGGQLVCAYEVKGTTGVVFPCVELTANELACAQRLGDQYVLVLVVGVSSPKAKFTLLRNPASLLEHGILTASPTVFRVELSP